MKAKSFVKFWFFLQFCVSLLKAHVNISPPPMTSQQSKRLTLLMVVCCVTILSMYLMVGTCISIIISIYVYWSVEASVYKHGKFFFTSTYDLHTLCLYTVKRAYNFHYICHFENFSKIIFTRKFHDVKILHGNLHAIRQLTSQGTRCLARRAVGWYLF